MNGMSFEAALDSRVDHMPDACVKCGKCVDVCPSVERAGVANADLIVAECRDLIAEHSLDQGLARDVVAKAMLGEQPLPLAGRRALSARLDA